VTRPILKWAGGKTQLLPELRRRIPRTEGQYFEPFIGGGAVFFAFAAEGRFAAGKAVINDQNPELANLYRILREAPRQLMFALDTYLLDPAWNTEAFFHAVRALEPQDRVERAARMVYLNKTAFNGLHRVNRAGKFNVPFGRYRNPRLYEAENILACSSALQGVSIRDGDFAGALHDVRPGDVVYLDPPYFPLSSTSNFTSYSGKFGGAEQERLASLMRQLVKQGAYCVQSNSDTPATRQLYEGFEIRTVQARRSVNADPAKRGKISELVIVGRPEGWVGVAEQPDLFDLAGIGS
jgi:DNA adenine methylase